MENEKKIFRLWLRKIIKDGVITGVQLAKELKVSSATVSAYHAGRIVSGVRQYTGTTFEIRKKIISITKTPYKEMLEIGRAELQPPQNIDQKIDARIDARLKEREAKNQAANEPQNDIDTKRLEKLKQHYSVVEGYQDQKTAISINQKLVEIEKLDPETFRDIDSELQTKINNLKRRLPKSVPGEAPNGTDS